LPAGRKLTTGRRDRLLKYISMMPLGQCEEETMFSHATLRINDLERSSGFYAAKIANGGSDLGWDD